MSNDDDLNDLLRALRAESPADSVKRERQKRPDSKRQFKTDLEMAERYVQEGETRVTRQLAVVAWLRHRGADSELAETLLEQFEGLLDLYRVRLAKLRAGASGH